MDEKSYNITMFLIEAISHRIDELKGERSYYWLSSESGVPQSSLANIRRNARKAASEQVDCSVNTKILSQLCLGLHMGLKEFFDSPLFTYENISD